MPQVLRALWDALTTEEWPVYDEEGENIANAQVRIIADSDTEIAPYWLYVDDVDGFKILTTDEVSQLRTSRKAHAPRNRN